MREVDAPASISRDTKTRVVRLTASIDGKDKGGISAKVKAELDKIELPAGVFTELKAFPRIFRNRSRRCCSPSAD